jgi:hypothetical protein
MIKRNKIKVCLDHKANYKIKIKCYDLYVFNKILN